MISLIIIIFILWLISGAVNGNKSSDTLNNNKPEERNIMHVNDIDCWMENEDMMDEWDVWEARDNEFIHSNNRE